MTDYAFLFSLFNLLVSLAQLRVKQSTYSERVWFYNMYSEMNSNSGTFRRLSQCCLFIRVYRLCESQGNCLNQIYPHRSHKYRWGWLVILLLNLITSSLGFCSIHLQLVCVTPLNHKALFQRVLESKTFLKINNKILLRKQQENGNEWWIYSSFFKKNAAML